MATKAQVVADYTFNTVSCTPITINFTDISSSAGSLLSTWEWDFGDGTMSTAQFPVHTYVTEGDFNVCLTATNGNGESDTECKMISFQTPIADAGIAIEQITCSMPDITLDGFGSIQGINYIYEWTTTNGNIDTGGNTLSPLVNAAGEYTLLVTDLTTGCTAESTVTVTAETEVPTVSIAPPDILTCSTSSVTLDATASSQGSGYVFEWTDPSNNPIGSGGIIITVSEPGVYTLTITGDNGCSAVNSVIVAENINTPTYSIPDMIVCFGEAVSLTAGTICSDCSIEITYTNGVVVCDSWPCSFIPTNDTYTFTLTDNNNGCSNSDNFTISISNEIELSSDVTDVSCDGELDGVIDLTVVGGIPPLQFFWSNNTLTEDLFSVSAGTYSVTVVDANDCAAVHETTIGAPSEISVEIINLYNVNCNGMADGIIELEASGGEPGYTFSWSNGSTDPNQSNLVAGVYQVTVTDANGCTTVLEDLLITEPTEIILSSTSTPASCNGGTDGSIDLTVSGGIPPYTYDWTPGFWITEDLTGLTAGTYTVFVTDNQDCQVSTEVIIEGSTDLGLFITDDTTLCAGQTVQLEVSWVPNVAYPVTWSPTFDLDDPTSYTPTASPTETTLYTVTVDSGNGCVDQAEVLVTVNQYLDFGLQLFSNSPVCEGESLEFYSNLGGAANYFWNGPNGFFSTEANPVIPVADASMTGGYSLEIIDNAGCNIGATFDVLVDDDCVWPGDTDTNNVVNNFDLLNIGLAFDSVGPSRFGGSLSWIGQGVEDWSQSTINTNVNFKHIDTDGNGIVNSDDTLAISQNWGLTHNFTGTTVFDQFTDLPIATDGSILNAPFYVEPDSLPEGETVGLDIILGDMTNVVSGLYGIAFSIEYDASIVVPGSAFIDFSNCWLGDVNADAITIQRDFPAEGRIDAAITRIDGMEMDGAGLFGEFIITLDDDILFWDPNGNQPDNEVFADFAITNYHLINFSQEEIIAAGTTTTAPVSGDVSTSIHNSYLDKQIQLYPNPANELFFISAKNLFIEQVKIYSTTKLIKAIETKTIDVIEIPTMDLPNGIYFIELQTEKGVVTKKVSIVK